jgi:hypothetical protein
MEDDTAIQLWKLLTAYEDEYRSTDPLVSQYTVADVKADIEESLPRERMADLQR